MKSKFLRASMILAIPGEINRRMFKFFLIFLKAPVIAGCQAVGSGSINTGTQESPLIAKPAAAYHSWQPVTVIHFPRSHWTQEFCV